VVRDPSKDKPLETEMGWLCAESHWKHCHVPEALVKEAEQKALQEVGTGVSEEKSMELDA
jgi:hypothetical protein